MEFEHIHLSGNISKEQIREILNTIPDPAHSEEMTEKALQGWAHVHLSASQGGLRYDANIQNDLLSVKAASKRLLTVVNNLTEDASFRLMVSLGASPPEYLKETLRPVCLAVDEATSIKLEVGRTKAGLFREALADLMVIWRWANKGQKFGTKFEAFAEIPLGVVFGVKKGGQPIEEPMREIRKEMNKNPQKYFVNYLP